MRRRPPRRQHAARADLARWLIADARDVALIGASRPRPETGPRTIAEGLRRWARSIERVRSIALLRRGAIVGLIAACVLQAVAILRDDTGVGIWLVPAIGIAVLVLVPGLLHRTTAPVAARMLDRDLGLGAGVTTALELERRTTATGGIGTLALADGREAISRSLAGARARLRPRHREVAAFVVLALALGGLLLVPPRGHGTPTASSPDAIVPAGHGAISAQSDPTRQKAGPDLRQFGQTQPTLPPLKATAGGARRTGAAGAQSGRRSSGGSSGGNGSVQASSRTAHNAGYLQSPHTNSSSSPGGTSGGANGGGSSTLETHEAPAASQVGGSDSTRVTAGADARTATGKPSQNGVPGRAGAHSGSSSGGGASAPGANQRSSTRRATPGGATAGTSRGGTSAAAGVVPQLGNGRTRLPIQPGYEATKGSKGSQGERAADANGAGGTSHSGQATGGAASTTGAGAIPYVAPGGATVAPVDRRLLLGYFGSFARVSAAGW